MYKGPGRLHFKELEGVFPLVGGYAALFHIEVTKYAGEHLKTILFRRILERNAS